MGFSAKRPRLLVLLVLVGLVVGCGETSSPEGAGPIGGASTTIPGETLPLGESPSPPVKAYWFGTKVGEAEAVLARQVSPDSYDVYYELPSAEGKSSAIPGQAPLPGEIHVTSVSLERESVRRIVKDYLRGGRPLALVSGEHVSFVYPGPSELGFGIVTEETFVHIVGPPITPLVPEEGQKLAAHLRPL